MQEKVIVSWSGGKDSTLALQEILQANRYKVAGFLTTVNRDFNRISIHGVQSVLLEQQANSLGFPLKKMFVPKDVDNVEYEDSLLRILRKNRNNGISSVVFGDIFLEDVRKYRERILSKSGLKSVFPLWGRNTGELAQSFVDRGFKAIVTVVDLNFLDRKFAGREFDRVFLSDLPESVDPCGENGEFHSFVYDGPIFRKKVAFAAGEVALRENQFYYCDLVPIE